MITLFDNETILNGYTREREKAGERRKAIEMAKKMLQESLPIDLIVRISGLSDSEIKAIRAKMVN